MTGQRMGAVAPRLVLVATIGLAIGGFHGWIATVIGAVTVTVFVQMRVRHQLKAAPLKREEGGAVVTRKEAQNFTSASLDSTPLEELSRRTEPSPPLYLSNGSETSSG